MAWSLQSLRMLSLFTATGIDGENPSQVRMSIKTLTLSHDGFQCCVNIEAAVVSGLERRTKKPDQCAVTAH